MENHHLEWIFPLKIVIFHMLNYQRVVKSTEAASAKHPVLPRLGLFRALGPPALIGGISGAEMQEFITTKMVEQRKSMGNLWGYHGSSVGTNFGVLKLVILMTLQKLSDYCNILQSLRR